MVVWAATNRTKGDIWFGVGVRSKYGGRGNDSVTRLGCPQADLDCKDDWTWREAACTVAEIGPSPHGLAPCGVAPPCLHRACLTGECLTCLTF
jgi:hypothetical protein